MLLLGLGIIGATVMPHNLYLHSGLLAPAGRAPRGREKRRAITENVRDSNTSLGFALFINAAILIAAGAAFHARGFTEIADLGEAYALLDPVLGSQIAAAALRHRPAGRRPELDDHRHLGRTDGDGRLPAGAPVARAAPAASRALPPSVRRWAIS